MSESLNRLFSTLICFFVMGLGGAIHTFIKADSGLFFMLLAIFMQLVIISTEAKGAR